MGYINEGIREGDDTIFTAKKVKAKTKL